MRKASRSSHLYNWSGATPEPGWIDGYLGLRERTGRPLWVGETGENSEEWITLELRLAGTNPSGRLAIAVDGAVAIELDAPDTGDWTNYQTIVAGQLHLESGAHTLRVSAVAGGNGVCDLDYLDLTL